MSARDKVLFTLGECTLTLYATDASGAPIVATPIWQGACEETLRILERWKVVPSRPSGSRYQKFHPMASTYEIVIDRNWLLKYADLADFQPSRRPFVLDVVWVDQDSGDWHRNVFYNVTIAERSRDARGADQPFTDTQSFNAEYFAATSGYGAVAIPAITPGLPYIVRWVGTDGVVNLYSYDATTHLFTLTASAENRATILYTPSLAAGNLEITFITSITTENGSGLSLQIIYTPALIVKPGGVEVRSIQQTAPNLEEIPRLEFLYGGVRVASLTPDALYVFNVNDAPASSGGLTADSDEVTADSDQMTADGGTPDATFPEAGAGRFHLYSRNDLLATLDRSGLKARSITAHPVFWEGPTADSEEVTADQTDITADSE